MQRRWFNTMLIDGSIRIGTLYYYRKIEDGEIGDEDEGTGIGKAYIKDGIYNATCLPPLAKHNIKILDDSTVRIMDWTIINKINVKNAYIYCLTTSPSLITMKSFKCDCCFQIRDINKFGLAIAKKLFSMDLLKNRKVFQRDCFYIDERKLNINNQDDFMKIYFIKDPKFIHQAEYRIVFEPKSGIIQDYVDLKIPTLKKLIKEIRL